MADQDDGLEPPEPVRDGDDDATTRLKANNAKLLQEAAEARKAKREAEAKLAEREEADARAAEEADKKAGDFAKVEERLTRERDDWKGRYEGLVGSHALTAALIEAKIDDTYKPAVSALLKEKGIEITKDGEPRIDGRPLGEYVTAWAQSDAGKPFIIDGNSGGGALGGKKDAGGANPWAAGSGFSLTEQDRITKQNPVLASRLKAEAGV